MRNGSCFSSSLALGPVAGLAPVKIREDDKVYAAILDTPKLGRIEGVLNREQTGMARLRYSHDIMQVFPVEADFVLYFHISQQGDMGMVGMAIKGIDYSFLIGSLQFGISFGHDC